MTVARSIRIHVWYQFMGSSLSFVTMELENEKKRNRLVFGAHTVVLPPWMFGHQNKSCTGIIIHQ